MKCPTCGTELRDDMRFCPACGTPIGGQASAGPRVTEVPPVMEDVAASLKPGDVSASMEKERSGSRKTISTILLVVLIALAVASAAFAAYTIYQALAQTGQQGTQEERTADQNQGEAQNQTALATMTYSYTTSHVLPASGEEVVSDDQFSLSYPVFATDSGNAAGVAAANAKVAELISNATYGASSVSEVREAHPLPSSDFPYGGGYLHVNVYVTYMADGIASVVLESEGWGGGVAWPDEYESLIINLETGEEVAPETLTSLSESDLDAQATDAVSSVYGTMDPSWARIDVASAKGNVNGSTTNGLSSTACYSLLGDGVAVSYVYVDGPYSASYAWYTVYVCPFAGQQGRAAGTTIDLSQESLGDSYTMEVTASE